VKRATGTGWTDYSCRRTRGEVAEASEVSETTCSVEVYLNECPTVLRDGIVHTLSSIYVLVEYTEMMETQRSCISSFMVDQIVGLLGQGGNAPKVNFGL